MLQLAEELDGLTAVRFSQDAGKSGSLAPIQFRTEARVKVLIGYFDENHTLWVQPP